MKLFSFRLSEFDAFGDSELFQQTFDDAFYDEEINRLFSPCQRFCATGLSRLRRRVLFDRFRMFFGFQENRTDFIKAAESACLAKLYATESSRLGSRLCLSTLLSSLIGSERIVLNDFSNA